MKIRKYRQRALAAALGWLAVGPPLSSAQEGNGTFNVVIENDVFAGTDNHYTSGIQLSYLSARDDLPGWLRASARLLPGIADDHGLRAGFQLGHSIFTPSDTDTTAPLPDDRPYAAWLYGGLAVLAETEDHLDTWILNLGIVGPSARGEQLQNNIHRLIGSEKANGWENQLDDEFGAALIYERRWRNLWRLGGSHYAIDFNPHLGFSLGNVASYANGGATFRIGNAASSDFGPPRIRPSLPGSGYFVPTDGFGWYLFLGIDVRAVAYTIFLDGNASGDSLSVDRKPLVADAQAGLALIFRQARLAYTYVYRTEEFEGQDGPDRFGSLSLSVKF